MAILAFGVGVGLSRAVVDAPRRWLRRFSLVSAALLLTMGGAALAIIGRDVLTRRSVLAKLPPAAAGAPNVLLIVIDAGRADALSSYGYQRAKTPSLDTLAGEGTLFELALSTAPWTLPSHVTMFSGRDVMPDSGRTVHFRRPMQTTVPVLAESFRDAGYETAGVVANFDDTGRDTKLDRGFTTYRDYRRTLEEVMRSSTLGQTALARGLYQSHTLAEAWAVVAPNDFTVPDSPSIRESAPRS
ncbi:MAG: sulfatase-like hydrolase/transferase [Gemmatimonadetes bacterium]|nr:sulfatase-like hydrolase/transferase [Gemmatimonadota bacterium]